MAAAFYLNHTVPYDYYSRVTERNLRVALDPEDADRLAALARESGVTSASWVRGAIRAASASAGIAAAVAGLAPPDRRGGARPGAGRPRRPSDPGATTKMQQEEKT